MKNKCKRLKASLLLFVITSLCLTSCDRVKDAVGVDKIADGDAAILPNENTSVNRNEQGAASIVSEASEIVEVERPEEKIFQVGEPVLKEYVINKIYDNREEGTVSTIDSGTVLMEYTVTNLQILTNISDEIKENLIVYPNPDAEDETGHSVKYNIDDFIDAEGNLDSDYLFVMVDINAKYISGTYEKTPEDVGGGVLAADNPIASTKELFYEFDGLDGKETMIWYEFFDKNGDPYVDVDVFARYYEFSGQGWTFDAKGQRFYGLKVGEENWKRVGAFFKKSDIEKWGIIVNFYDGYRVPLDIDLSEYE